MRELGIVRVGLLDVARCAQQAWLAFRVHATDHALAGRHGHERTRGRGDATRTKDEGECRE